MRLRSNWSGWQAFFYGRHQIPLQQLLDESPFAQALTKQQLDDAYALGVRAGQETTDGGQNRVNATYEQAEKILENRKDDGERQYSARAAEGVKVKRFSNRQKDAYQLMQSIAPAVKVNMAAYEGGKEWGYYDHETDEIYINVNATWSRANMMAFTLGHELAHRAKAGSPKKFAAFADFLMEQYGKQGASVNDMIIEQITAAERGGRQMTTEEAFEEVVADACQWMLLDTDAGRRLAEWGAQSSQNKDFLAKLKQIINDLIGRLRRYFKNVDPDSMAAREFAKIDANAKQILADMFVDMSIDAGEKLSTIKAAGLSIKNTAQQDGVNQELYFKKPVAFDYGMTTEKISDYVKKAYSKENIESYIKYKKASDRLIQELEGEIDITGYAHALRDNDIRHIKNSHGEDTNEKYPVYQSDIAMIPDIVENYDKVFYKTNANGEPGIVFVKVGSDNVIYYVEAVTTQYNKEKLLVNKQMIKTGFDDIPNLRGLISAINKKQSSHQYLADLQEIRKAYAQSVKDDYSMISISEEGNVVKENMPHKTAVAEDLSPRELLLNTVEGMVANDTEYKKLQEYRQKIQELNATEEHLERLNAQLKELYFAKGGRDYEMINKLEGQRAEALTKLNRYDSQLINLENTKPIRDIVNRMKQAAYDRGFQKAKDHYKQKADAREEKLKQHYQESRRNAVERHDKAQIRQQIRKDVERLASLLNKGNKQKMTASAPSAKRPA